MLHSKSNCFIQLKCLADVGVGRLKKQERQKVGKTKGSSLKSKPKMSLFSCFALVLILANYTHTTAAPNFLDILTRQYSCMLSNFFYFPSRFDYTSGSGLCSKQWLNQHYYKIKSGMPQIKKHEYILFCFFSWSFQPLRNCIHKIISGDINTIQTAVRISTFNGKTTELFMLLKWDLNGFFNTSLQIPCSLGLW